MNDYHQLMTYAAGIMVPRRVRKYFINVEDWEEKTIPKEDGDALIGYSSELKDAISEKDPEIFRNFIRRHEDLHLEETGRIVELDNKTLETVMGLIEMEYATDGIEGRG